jgi:hypothetical protein
METKRERDRYDERNGREKTRERCLSADVRVSISTEE